MAAKTKAAAAAKKPDAQKPGPAAKQPPEAAAKPAVPEARPAFVGPDGKTLQSTMAVYQVVERYDETAAAKVAATGTGGNLAGLPKLVELVGLFTTSSHTGAATAAREAGLLAADADAMTANVRFVSAIDQPREREQSPADDAGQKGGK